MALLEGNIMVVQAPLTRRQVLEKQGGFDESLPALEDWDLWLRCAIAGTAFLYTEQPGTRSLVRVNTASLSHNNAAMTAGAAKIRNKLAAIAPGSVPLVRAQDDCRRRWHDRVCQAAREISGVLRDRGKLILVDDYVVSGLLQASSDVYPMMEREGGYLGPPVDGDEALQQLDRLRTRGTIRLAFVFNVFWWLDHYHALRTYVLREGRIIHASPVLKVYEFSGILGVAAGHRRRASNVVIGSMFQEQHDRTGQMGDAGPLVLPDPHARMAALSSKPGRAGRRRQ